jgi:WD40 repeat protein
LALSPGLKSRGKPELPASEQETAPSTRHATRLQGIPSPCSAVALSADGTTVVTGHRDGTVAFWNVETGQLLQKAEGQFMFGSQPIAVDSLALSAAGRVVAAASFAQVQLRTWSLGDERPLGSRIFGAAYLMPLAISPDGKLVATAGNGQGQSLNIWEATLRGRKMELRGHMDFPMAVAFSPDGRTLVTGGNDGLLKLWHLPTEREVATLLSLERGIRVEDLAFSPKGDWLGAADNQGVLHLFHGPQPPAAEVVRGF